jgi:putative long chain acyl-CoA synthase
MALGGAIASGARCALASATDKDTFWDEVRRYGATHVSYTWTSLSEITDGAVHPAEQHHSIRLFIGSGLPRGLWRRVEARFAPARVLEFYASAEGEAILANVAAAKTGSMGRPLPGTADVAIAAYDAEHRRLILDSNGMARECRTDETGLLLARLDPAMPAQHVLRSLFRRDDAWQSTGDLFTRDRDGDLWLVDAVDNLIPTAGGLVAPSQVRSALEDIPDVAVAVVYGVASGTGQILVGTVSLLDGGNLRPEDLEVGMRSLDPAQRPQYVQVVREIPVTTWSRPRVEPLRKRGIPKPARRRPVWRLADDGESYEPLT